MYVGQRPRVCDVCVANMGEGFCKKPEPHTRCYTLFKKYFSFNFILTGFLFNNYKFVFLFWILGRGVRGECPKSKTPYPLFMLYQELALQYKNHLVRPDLFLF